MSFWYGRLGGFCGLGRESVIVGCQYADGPTNTMMLNIVSLALIGVSVSTNTFGILGVGMYSMS